MCTGTPQDLQFIICKSDRRSHSTERPKRLWELLTNKFSVLLRRGFSSHGQAVNVKLTTATSAHRHISSALCERYSSTCAVPCNGLKKDGSFPNPFRHLSNTYHTIPYHANAPPRPKTNQYTNAFLIRSENAKTAVPKSGQTIG